VPDFLLPDLGEGLTEAEIVAWHVEVGDTVRVDQPVVEVETAKAVVEVPVPFAGLVTMLHGKVGDLVEVGKPLVTVVEATSDPQTRDFQPPAAEDSASGNVLIGYGTSASTPRRRRPARTAVQDRVAVVSPLVRRLAREAGIDVRAISGSGADGLITRRDIDQAIQSARADRRPPGAELPAATPAAHDGITRIPIRGTRKAIADKLSRSRREIPEATVWVDVDATRLLELRSSLNADSAASRISLLGLISRFAILGLRRFPELNARVEGGEIVMGPAVNLGFAAQTGRGLLVPVLHEAQRHSVEQLCVAFGELTERAREGKLAADELTGGTFTINNYGVFGVDGSAAIINHPEVAILGLGRIIDRPWVLEGQLAIRKLTELTLAFDHRVCDGATAGGFLRFVADCIESPAGALRYL
jgi:pyruvate dehydrogenase E2 component (dihydrolipoamide acetyltransferase)